jgi:polysaccharide transporter, PST family
MYSPYPGRVALPRYMPQRWMGRRYNDSIERIRIEPSPATSDSEVPESASLRAAAEERIDLEKGGLREQTAKGTIVNAAFQVGLTALGLVKGLAVAAFLTTSELGLWGLVFTTLVTIAWLKQVGVGDKYIQQAEVDQEAAFQKAFTIEMIYGGITFLLVAVALPVFALVYGRTDILMPGLVLSLIFFATALQAPLWIFYRRMDFVRQRALQAVDPVVTFVITVGLAAAGTGYWGLVFGTVAGSFAGAAASIKASPFRLRRRFDRATFKEYLSFSWPLFVVGGSSLLMVQSSMIAGEAAVGLAGIGAISLAGIIANFTDRVDEIVTQTLYPAICAVRDRRDLLLESFVTSNRLVLMWGVPFGMAILLFAPDLVRYVLGTKWEFATGLLQVFGVAAAVKQIGFNWTAFMRATDNTRPMAVVGVLSTVVWLLAGVPLILTQGLLGFALATAVLTGVQLVARTYYLGRLFPGFSMLHHAVRAWAPTLPPVALVLALRLVEPDARTLAVAVSELVVFLAATAATLFVAERPLLREVAGYVRGEPRPVPAA